MAKNQITKADLALEMCSDDYAVGTYLHYVGCQDKELYRIVEQKSDKQFMIAQIDLATMSEKSLHQTSLDSLKQYYRIVKVDINKLHSLALRLLDGDEIEDLGVSASDEDGTSLMHLGDKATLVALRGEIAKAQEVAEMIRRQSQCIVDEMHRKMMEKVNKLNGVISTMQNQMSRIDYVIQTIETYAGIKESVVTLQKGVPADGSFPVVIRQAVIYLDEEMALIDPEFDWQKMESFDNWLLTNDNYKTLLPDIKSIVAIKPRRKDKRYTDGSTFKDAYHNWTMNEPNHVTLFLIRNGENLYRLGSEHIALLDRMFPNPGEYAGIMDKEKNDRFVSSNDDLRESAQFRKLYTKVSFLLQGLFERSDVFSPHNFTGSLIKMEGLEGHVEMNFELDTERQLSDGHPDFKDWLAGLNAGLSEGKRVMVVKAGMNHSGYEFCKKDFVVYYSGEWNLPGYPMDGVYTLYKSNPKGYDKYYEERHPFIVKFMSTEPSYTWGDIKERKNRTSIHVNPEELGILNYDDLKMEDVDYYLNSRLHRSQYSTFVVMLQKVKKIMMDEQVKEQDFIGMLVGQVLSRGLSIKEGYTYEGVARKALETVKNRLKWKRPVSSKEKETYTLVERTLFSQAYINKYFNQ